MTNYEMTKKYVLTGGPGNGKSTIIEILNSKGVYTIDEAANYFIKEQQRNGGNILPWRDKHAFQMSVFEIQSKWEKEIPASIEKAVLDRGIPDGIAYYHVYDLSPPRELVEAAKNAKYESVFLVEPLKELEITETRRENRPLQIKIHNAIKNVYEDLGYDLIKVPVMDKEVRAKYILDRI